MVCGSMEGRCWGVGGVRAPHDGGADGGGEVQGEGAVLRDAGAHGAAERAAGGGAAAWGALADAGHGQQPGAERGRR